jgi:phosphatidylserine/phosphatidylglycerophosphate/cardiolipin synthase-like enzyme
MTTHPLSDISVLDTYAAAPFAPGYPTDRRTFFSPVDQIHQCLVDIIGMAQTSLDLAMYGFDDDDLCTALIAAMANPAISVRLTLDSSQSSGVHEKALLAQNGLNSNDISIGTSEKGAIMHLKSGVIDGTVLFTGSTNWSASGEGQQDNQLTVAISPVECVQLSARIDAIHAYQVANPKP